MAGYDLEKAPVHVRCTGDCGFVVADRYFEEKNKFTPGICPKCGAPTYLAHPFTTEVATGYHMDLQSGRISRGIPAVGG